MDSVFSFVIGLLTAALSLLGFVQQHPELPPASRDQANQIAQQAITQATNALNTAPTQTQNTTPTQPVATPKSNIFNGQSSIVLEQISAIVEQDSVIKISWSSKNAPKGSYVALSITDATSGEKIGSIDGTINSGGNYDPHPASGTINWRGYINDIDVGFNIADVQRFSSCTGNWPNTVCSPRHSGKYKIHAELRPTNYCVRGQSGEAQPNCSSSLYATTDSNVFTVALHPASSKSATIDPKVKEQKLDVQSGCGTFDLQPCGFITVSGTAVNVKSLDVFLVKGSYAGATDYDTLLTNASRTLDSPPSQMEQVSISAGTWTTRFVSAVGAYRVYVFDIDGISKKLLTQGTAGVY